MAWKTTYDASKEVSKECGIVKKTSSTRVLIRRITKTDTKQEFTDIREQYLDKKKTEENGGEEVWSYSSSGIRFSSEVFAEVMKVLAESMSVEEKIDAGFDF